MNLVYCTVALLTITFFWGYKGGPYGKGRGYMEFTEITQETNRPRSCTIRERLCDLKFAAWRSRTPPWDLRPANSSEQQPKFETAGGRDRTRVAWVGATAPRTTQTAGFTAHHYCLVPWTWVEFGPTWIEWGLMIWFQGWRSSKQGVWNCCNWAIIDLIELSWSSAVIALVQFFLSKLGAAYSVDLILFLTPYIQRLLMLSAYY